MRGARLDILMITHNRPSYTKMALSQLLDSCETGMRVWVWQNGNNTETRDVVSSFAGHRYLHKIQLCAENKGLREPTNWFWERSDAPFLAKVDDDCLMPTDWAGPLIDAHHHAPQLSMIACWHFYDDDFVPELASWKIRELPGGHRILRNCWVQGSGYIMKRRVFEELGCLRPRETFTDYGIRACLAGWINGWYFPLIHEEHMDDPRSPYTRFHSEADFSQNRPLSAVSHNVYSLEEWRNRARWMARSLQEASLDPRRYVGWRAKLQGGLKRLKRFAGWHEPWRLAR